MFENYDMIPTADLVNGMATLRACLILLVVIFGLLHILTRRVDKEVFLFPLVATFLALMLTMIFPFSARFVYLIDNLIGKI